MPPNSGNPTDKALLLVYVVTNHFVGFLYVPNTVLIKSDQHILFFFVPQVGTYRTMGP